MYHGRHAWPGEAHFGALFAGPEPLRTYWPEFGFQVYDLSAYGDEEIRGAALLQGILLLLKYILRPEMGERLPGILGVLGELTRQESGVEALYTILRYVSQASEAVSEEGLRQAVTEAFSTTGDEIMTTLAEKWVEEGMEKGMEERLREDVLEVLAVRFGQVPAEVEEQMRRLRGRKVLEGWLRLAVVVESLPVFAEELGRGKGEG